MMKIDKDKSKLKKKNSIKNKIFIFYVFYTGLTSLIYTQKNSENKLIIYNFFFYEILSQKFNGMNFDHV